MSRKKSKSKNTRSQDNGSHVNNSGTSSVRRAVGHLRKDAEHTDTALNNLVAIRGGTVPDLNVINREWHIDAATLSDALSQTTDPNTRRQLELTMLHSYYKAAAIDDNKAKEQGRQVSPFLAHAFRYHRSVDNLLIHQSHVAYEKALGFRATLDTKIDSYDTRFLHLVSNDTFSEVMSREHNTPGISPENLNPQNLDDFKTSLGQMFDNVAGMSNTPVDSKVMFDASSMLGSKLAGVDPSNTKGVVDQLAGEMEKAFTDQLTDYMSGKDWTGGDSTVDPQQAKSDFLANMNRVARGTQIMGFMQDDGNTVMVAPKFMSTGLPAMEGHQPSAVSSHGDFRKSIDQSLKDSGYHLDPASAMNAWLSKESLDSILQRHTLPGDRPAALPSTTLATSGGTPNSTFATYNDFIGSNVFKSFTALSDNPALSDKPYVSVLSKATSEALTGLGQDLNSPLASLLGKSTFKDIMGDTPSSLGRRDIDGAFNQPGLQGLLQTSYFRMANAMAEATSFPNDFFHFSNQIELIHQQMSMLLAITQPYQDGDFAAAVLGHMEGIIPGSLTSMSNAQLYPSAMHTAATTLSSVEAQKGSNDLSVAVLKDNYYETASDAGHVGIVFKSKTYDSWQLNGDTLANKTPLGNDSLTKPTDGTDLQGFKDSGKKLDVFIADFRHNISPTRKVYGVEDLSHQVDQLFNQGLVQKNFTVAIDNTIDKIRSSDVKGFLDHNKDRIAKGDLNVVIFRSAQKFDMLGIDNYYGGYAVTVNNPSAYSGFNGRMFNPRDGLGGLNRQGLTHLLTSTPNGLENYRGAVMDNTKKLYDDIPDSLKHGTSPGFNQKVPSDYMAVSRIQDDKQVFLDIKFPVEALQSRFESSLINYAKANGLPVDQRSSFGFATSNLTVIPGVGVRFNPGLEDAETIEKYADFFKQWNDIIQKGIDANQTNGDIVFEIAQAFPAPP